jgi:hypothetical protein
LPYKSSEAWNKCLRDRPPSLPMQPTPLDTADSDLIDSSLEFHVKNEFLTVIPVYTVKRLPFLRTTPIILLQSP